MARVLVLTAVTGSQIGKRYTVEERITSIGSAPNNDIVFHDRAIEPGEECGDLGCVGGSDLARHATRSIPSERCQVIERPSAHFALSVLRRRPSPSRSASTSRTRWRSFHACCAAR